MAMQAERGLTRRLVARQGRGGRPEDGKTALAAAMFDAGKELPEIAAELGISQSALYQRLRNLELRQAAAAE